MQVLALLLCAIAVGCGGAELSEASATYTKSLSVNITPAGPETSWLVGIPCDYGDLIVSGSCNYRTGREFWRHPTDEIEEES
jgi:hypothetical protein